MRGRGGINFFVALPGLAASQTKVCADDLPGHSEIKSGLSQWRDLPGAIVVDFLCFGGPYKVGTWDKDD